MGRHFFVFSYSTFHPKHLTLNIQHLSLLKRTPFAFQNESFCKPKGLLLFYSHIYPTIKHCLFSGSNA